jgi:3-isopropylmalate/(R)-2-methylmalate dehydratase small subunit
MTMQPFTVVEGPAAPLLRANVDTDVIIRIEHLRKSSTSQLGHYAFEALRYLPDGSENSEFVLNQPPFRAAPILLAGENFGCGSSREHAVWALQGLGIRCVLAPSFGDIFYANCFQNGLLPIRLPIDVIERFAEHCAAGAHLNVDLLILTIGAPDGSSTAFEVDSRRRELLIKGLDDIGLTLQAGPTIRAWQEMDRNKRPWVWLDSAWSDTSRQG